MTSAELSIPMLAMDAIAIGYTLWIMRRGSEHGGAPVTWMVLALGWMALLHAGLSTQALFPAEIPGWAFLGLVFAFVGAVGVLLFATSARRTLFSLTQPDLLQLQGIRVYFGAGFLAMAAVGALPSTFGILDGFTHVTAGFLGLLASQRVAAGGGAMWIWLANVFGLLDILVVASTISLVLLSAITPHHPMMYAVFLPAPLWLWFHVVSLTKVLRGG